MQTVIRHIELDGAAVILDLGFIPDLVKMYIDDATNVDITTWFKRMVDDESMYGVLLTGSSGVTTRLTTAVTGISEYDTVTQKVLLPAPNGEGEQSASMPSAFVAGTAQPTARTTTVLGTVTKPSSGNENGYIYECTASAGVYGTEPTAWPTVPGTTVSDGTNTWICRDSKVKNIGVKGITIGGSVANNTNGLQCYVEAIRADKDPADTDAGGVVAGSPV